MESHRPTPLRLEWLIYEHEQPMQWGRMDRRTAIGVAVRLESAAEPSVGETAYIENISNHGARVISEHSWQPRDRLLLASSDIGFRKTVGHVVYCQSLPDGRFAVGLHFDDPIFESVIGFLLKGNRH